MYDTQRIMQNIAEIEKHLSELESYSIKSINDLTNSMRFHAASMLLLAIFTKIIDIGSDILAGEESGAPSRYADIFPLLAKVGLINTVQAIKFNSILKERNTLAHFYGEITEQKLFSLIKEYPLIREFINAVKKRIKALSDN